MAGRNGKSELPLTRVKGLILLAVGYPSGQRGQTVNLLAMPSMVRIHHLPPPFICRGNVGFIICFQ
jgi:hypothetical protein